MNLTILSKIPLLSISGAIIFFIVTLLSSGEVCSADAGAYQDVRPQQNRFSLVKLIKSIGDGEEKETLPPEYLPVPEELPKIVLPERDRPKIHYPSERTEKLAVSPSTSSAPVKREKPKKAAPPAKSQVEKEVAEAKSPSAEPDNTKSPLDVAPQPEKIEPGPRLPAKVASSGEGSKTPAAPAVPLDRQIVKDDVRLSGDSQVAPKEEETGDVAMTSPTAGGQAAVAGGSQNGTGDAAPPFAWESNVFHFRLSAQQKRSVPAPSPAQINSMETNQSPGGATEEKPSTEEKGNTGEANQTSADPVADPGMEAAPEPAGSVESPTVLVDEPRPESPMVVEAAPEPAADPATKDEPVTVAAKPDAPEKGEPAEEEKTLPMESPQSGTLAQAVLFPEESDDLFHSSSIEVPPGVNPALAYASNSRVYTRSPIPPVPNLNNPNVVTYEAINLSSLSSPRPAVGMTGGSPIPGGGYTVAAMGAPADEAMMQAAASGTPENVFPAQGPKTFGELIARSVSLARKGIPYRPGQANPDAGMDSPGAVKFLLTSMNYNNVPADAGGLMQWFEGQGSLIKVKKQSAERTHYSQMRPGCVVFWGQQDGKATNAMIYLGQHPSTGRPCAFGARGANQRGIYGSEVDIFDFRVPPNSRLLGYAAIPGLYL